MAYESIDLIRANCGGAGFSAWSTLPQQLSDYSPVPTYEGDNTVMAQQSFNYIQKKIDKISKGVPTTGILRYLNNLDKLVTLQPAVKTVEEFLQLDHLDNALAVKASFQILDVM